MVENQLTCTQYSGDGPWIPEGHFGGPHGRCKLEEDHQPRYVAIFISLCPYLWLINFKLTGVRFITKLKDAVPERSDHRYVLSQLESVIEARFIQQWTAEVKAWEADCSMPNPFKPRTQCK